MHRMRTFFEIFKNARAGFAFISQDRIQYHRVDNQTYSVAVSNSQYKPLSTVFDPSLLIIHGG